MAVGNIITPLQQDWVKPTDWIDISSVGNNEINLLVMDGTTAFAVNLPTGTYSIDWGDGVVETGRVGGTSYSHTYVWGSGTATSYGYTVYKIRIFNAGSNITRFWMNNPVIPNVTQSRGAPLLWLVMGTTGLTSTNQMVGASNAIYSPALQSVTLPSVLTGITTFNQAFMQATSLTNVIGLESTWGSVTTMQDMFNGCAALKRVNLPPTLPNTITNMSTAFSGCASLTQINLPTSWPTGLTDLSSTFSGCISLKTITLPSTWPSGLTTLSNTFQGCNTLQSITLPASGFPNTLTTITSMFSGCFSLGVIDFGVSWGTGLTNASVALGGCRSLQSVTFPTGSNNLTNVNAMFQGAAPNSPLVQRIINLDKLGSTTAQVDMGSFVSSNMYITGSVNINAAVSRIAWQGASATSKTVLTGLRLLNTGSNFVNTAPQVNVSFTNMDTGSLQTLFGDLKNSTTGSINITGANGATTLFGPYSMTFSSGSDVGTIGSTANISVGMELSSTSAGGGITIISFVNANVATNTFSTPRHGLSDGDRIKFNNLGAVNNIAFATVYYVINSSTNDFQISLTEGGSVYDIQGTSGNVILECAPTVVSIVPNTSVQISRICGLGAGATNSFFSRLKRTYATFKGWTITG